ncbi:hypothetical protein ABZ412_13725 [Nocardia sp. NPDC005746]|uniref:hypothetical protein n=1 Tax=Nocardia sp. NPDC005746 TaxID=3157062 RepID=UPI0033DC281F
MSAASAFTSGSERPLKHVQCRTLCPGAEPGAISGDTDSCAVCARSSGTAVGSVRINGKQVGPLSNVIRFPVPAQPLSGPDDRRGAEVDAQPKPQRREVVPNEHLSLVMESLGITPTGLAHRMRAVSESDGGRPVHLKHTNIVGYRDGLHDPKPRTLDVMLTALSLKAGRQITAEQIGYTAPTPAQLRSNIWKQLDPFTADEPYFDTPRTKESLSESAAPRPGVTADREWDAARADRLRLMLEMAESSAPLKERDIHHDGVPGRSVQAPARPAVDRRQSR